MHNISRDRKVAKKRKESKAGPKGLEKRLFRHIRCLETPLPTTRQSIDKKRARKSETCFFFEPISHRRPGKGNESVAILMLAKDHERPEYISAIGNVLTYRRIVRPKYSAAHPQTLKEVFPSRNDRKAQHQAKP